MSAATLPALIQRFFTDRLCIQMEASRHTIAGYRDTFRLLLRFASARHGRPPVKLTVEDIDVVFGSPDKDGDEQTVKCFLQATHNGR